MQEAKGSVPVRLIQGCRADALNLAGVQPDKRGRMVSSGTAKRGLAVVKDNQEQRSRPSGKPRTPTLKVSIGCTEGFIGEDMFFYAGPGALRRAELAKRVLEERFKIVALEAEEVRIDFIGLNAIHGPISPRSQPEPYEVAVRVAARTRTRRGWRTPTGWRPTGTRSGPRTSAARWLARAAPPHLRLVLAGEVEAKLREGLADILGERLVLE